MNAPLAIISFLLEAEDDDLSVKDIGTPEVPVAGPTKVKRYGRWKVVDMPDYQFLISFLTPVAYLDKRTGVFYETSKQWSPTTNKHIGRWIRQIANTPEWRNDPKNHVQSEYDPGSTYVSWPRTVPRRQTRISALFRSLMPTMKISTAQKRRMYHVDPSMRYGAPIQRRAAEWQSGHLKHHDTGNEGLPRPGEAKDFEKFFADFAPHAPEMYDWGSGYRSREPYEREDR